jgi:hypothetical protein
MSLRLGDLRRAVRFSGRATGNDVSRLLDAVDGVILAARPVAR